jgi:hypothetical protein
MARVTDKCRREVEHTANLAIRGAIENAGLTSDQITDVLNDIQNKIRLRQELQKALTSVFKDFFENISKAA